jgi:hypothetical protein
MQTYAYSGLNSKRRLDLSSIVSSDAGKYSAQSHNALGYMSTHIAIIQYLITMYLDVLNQMVTIETKKSRAGVFVDFVVLL